MMLILLIEAAWRALAKIAPGVDLTAPFRIAAFAMVVALVLAGFFLRTWWSALIVPAFFWTGAILFGSFVISWKEGHFILVLLFGVIFSIPVALLALVGTALRNRFGHPEREPLPLDPYMVRTKWSTFTVCLPPRSRR